MAGPTPLNTNYVRAGRATLAVALSVVVVGFIVLVVRRPAPAAANAPTTTTVAPATSCATTITPVPGIGTISCPSPAGVWDSPPTIVVPPSRPPTHLEADDLIKGSGPPVKNGDNLIVEYELATYSSRHVVQSSWHGSSFMFTEGQGDVNAGWNQGIPGMQAGGRRELIVPAPLGYGDTSPAPGIARNDTLVYIVDVFQR